MYKFVIGVDVDVCVGKLFVFVYKLVHIAWVLGVRMKCMMSDINQMMSLAYQHTYYVHVCKWSMNGPLVHPFIVHIEQDFVFDFW